jgi:hypothetical protein
MDIRPQRGKGVEIRVAQGPRPRTRRERGLFTAGRATESATAFLRRYAAGLEALPRPSDGLAAYLGALGAKERDLWTTLLPSASALQRSSQVERRAAAKAGLEAGEGSDGWKGPAELLSRTRDWALAEIAQALAEGGGTA